MFLRGFREFSADNVHRADRRIEVEQATATWLGSGIEPLLREGHVSHWDLSTKQYCLLTSREEDALQCLVECCYLLGHLFQPEGLLVEEKGSRAI